MSSDTSDREKQLREHLLSQCRKDADGNYATFHPKEDGLVFTEGMAQMVQQLFALTRSRTDAS